MSVGLFFFLQWKAEISKCTVTQKYFGSHTREWRPKKFKLSSLEAQSQPEVILQGLESLLGNQCFRGMVEDPGGGSVEGGRWREDVQLLSPLIWTAEDATSCYCSLHQALRLVASSLRSVLSVR